jgi:hypothetical protein
MSKCLPEQSLMCNCLCARWPDRISQKNPVNTQILPGFDYTTTRPGNYMAMRTSLAAAAARMN